MVVDAKTLVKAVKRAAKKNGKTLKDVGEELGWNYNKTKNIFAGRTQLSGDDVLRILGNEKYALSRLRPYAPYWRLRREVLAAEEEFDRADELNVVRNESMLIGARRIQRSLMDSNVRKPISELARDVMAGCRWWRLSDGWICAMSLVGSDIEYRPIAPDFATAIAAMLKLGWIWRDKTSSYAEWRKITGEKTGDEANEHAENVLRDFLLDENNGFDLDNDFRQAATGEVIGNIEVDRREKFAELITAVEKAVTTWTKFKWPDEPDKDAVNAANKSDAEDIAKWVADGVPEEVAERTVQAKRDAEVAMRMKNLYRNKFDYLRSIVLEMCFVHDSLHEDGIAVDAALEERYNDIISQQGDNRAVYSLYIAPILAVSDRGSKLVDPKPRELKQFIRLSDC